MPENLDLAFRLATYVPNCQNNKLAKMALHIMIDLVNYCESNPMIQKKYDYLDHCNTHHQLQNMELFWMCNSKHLFHK